MGLVVIADGGVHTLEYLQNNGVYPTMFFTDIGQVADMFPYFGNDDDLLVIIRGMTDINFSELRTLNEILENCTNVKSLKIISNVELENFTLEYCLYDGDPMFSKFLVKSVEKLFKKKDNTLKDGLLDAYKVYNCNDNECIVYAKNTDYLEVPDSDIDIRKHIIQFDLFENQ